MGNFGKRFKFGLIHLYRKPHSLGGFGIFFHDCDPKRPYHPSWEEWERKIKKLCPIQYWFREEFLEWFEDVPPKLKELKYQIRCYFFPYNVLKLQHLPRTWSDECTLLPHAIFAVLERFMGGDPSSIVDYDPKFDENSGMTQEEWEKWGAPHREFWKDINEVWSWWQDKDKREQQLEDAWKDVHVRLSIRKEPINSIYEEVERLEQKFEEEETEMLLKIIKHRQSLWT